MKKFNIIITVCVEFFKVMIACELSIFVPQSCKDSNTGTSHLCTTSEIIKELTPYKRLIFILNTFTVAIFIFMYITEVMREIWLAEHFKFNPSHSEYHLSRYRSRHRSLFNALNRINIVYYHGYQTTMCIYCVNALVSGTFIFSYSNYGLPTMISFFTNITLCWSKLVLGLYVSHRSLSLNIPMSYYATKNIEFNEIDPTYRIRSTYFLERSRMSIISNVWDLSVRPSIDIPNPNVLISNKPLNSTVDNNPASAVTNENLNSEIEISRPSYDDPNELVFTMPRIKSPLRTNQNSFDSYDLSVRNNSIASISSYATSNCNENKCDTER